MNNKIKKIFLIVLVIAIIVFTLSYIIGKLYECTYFNSSIKQAQSLIENAQLNNYTESLYAHQSLKNMFVFNLIRVYIEIFAIITIAVISNVFIIHKIIKCKE